MNKEIEIPEGYEARIEGNKVIIELKESEGERIRTFEEVSSIQPHWKPSEDEERLINTSISFLKDFADKGYENAVECIDWLKSKLNGNTCE